LIIIVQNVILKLQ